MYQNLNRQLQQVNQAEKSASRLLRHSPSVLAPTIRSRTFGHQRSLEAGSRKKGQAQVAQVGAGLAQSTSEEVLQTRNSANFLANINKSNGSQEKNRSTSKLASAQLLQSQFERKSRAAIADQKSMFSQTISTAKSYTLAPQNQPAGFSTFAATTAKKNIQSLLQQSLSGSKNSSHAGTKSVYQTATAEILDSMQMKPKYPEGLAPRDPLASQQSFGQRTPMKQIDGVQRASNSSQPFADVSNQFQQRVPQIDHFLDSGTPTVAAIIRDSCNTSVHHHLLDLTSASKRGSQRAAKENEEPSEHEPTAAEPSSTRSNRSNDRKQPVQSKPTRMTSTLSSMPGTRHPSNISLARLAAEDASPYLNDQVAQDASFIVGKHSNNPSQLVSHHIDMDEQHDNGQLEQRDAQNDELCLEVVDQALNEARGELVVHEGHDTNFRIQQNAASGNSTENDYQTERMIHEIGPYEEGNDELMTNEIVDQHYQVDTNNLMDDDNQAAPQLSDEKEERFLPLAEFMKLNESQLQHPTPNYQADSNCLETALDTGNREYQAEYFTDEQERTKQQLLDSQADLMLLHHQQSTPQSNSAYEFQTAVVGPGSRSDLPTTSTRSFKGYGARAQPLEGSSENQDYQSELPIDGGYTIQQNSHGACYINTTGHKDNGVITELNEEDLTSRGAYQAQNFDAEDDQVLNNEYAMPSGQVWLHTFDQRGYALAPPERHQASGSLGGSHSASRDGKARPGSSNYSHSRGSQFIDLQSPLTYLSKDKKQAPGQLQRLNQPVLRQKYQGGGPVIVSHPKHTKGTAITQVSDTAHSSFAAESKSNGGARSSRSQFEPPIKASSRRPIWQRDHHVIDRQLIANQTKTAPEKPQKRMKPAWGVRKQPSIPKMTKNKSASLLKREVRPSKLDALDFATAFMGTPEPHDNKMQTVQSSGYRIPPEPENATPKPITLNFTADPSTTNLTPCARQRPGANVLLDQPALTTQQTASTHQLIGLTPAMRRQADQLAEMPIFIDQLQLTQRSAINSNDDEAANALFNPHQQSKHRLSTAHSSRPQAEQIATTDSWQHADQVARQAAEENCATAASEATSQGKKRRVGRQERQVNSTEKKRLQESRSGEKAGAKQHATLEVHERCEPLQENYVEGINKSSRRRMLSTSQHLQELLDTKDAKLQNYLTGYAEELETTHEVPEPRSEFIMSLEQNFERQKKHREMMNESYQLMQENDKMLQDMEQQDLEEKDVVEGFGGDALSQDILAAASLKHRRVTSKQLRRQLAGSFSSSYLLGQSGGKQRTTSLTSVGQLKRVASGHGGYGDDQQPKGTQRRQDSDLYTFQSPQLVGCPQQKSTSSVASRPKVRKDSTIHQLSYCKSSLIPQPKTVGQSRQQSTVKKAREGWMFGGQTSRQRLAKKSNMCASTTSLATTTNLGRKRSACSFDPAKRSMIKDHITHKGRVTNLQAEVCEQKQIIRRHLADKLQKLRTMVIQTQKRAELAANENDLLKEQIKSLRMTTERQQLKNADVSRNVQHVQGEINELVNDRTEFDNYKVQLAAELRQEMRFKTDIQRIAAKYKRLIADQRKDKERIAQGLVQQRKIMANAQRRRDTLLDDTNKIYDNFATVVNHDKQRQVEISKKCRVKLSQQDQQVLKC